MEQELTEVKSCNKSGEDCHENYGSLGKIISNHAQDCQLQLLGAESKQKAAQTESYQVYPRRWLLLFVICIINATNSMVSLYKV